MKVEELIDTLREFQYMTDEEIDDVIDGKELYMDADEVRDRLVQREELRDIEQQVLLEAFEAQQKVKEKRE